MRVLMITGSYPPMECGVGDYTAKLVNGLRAQNCEVQVLNDVDWSLLSYKRVASLIKQKQWDIVHIQFPTIGYKLSFLPPLLSLNKKTVVTIHEVSQFHMIRKLWLFPFSFNKNLIFTTSSEYHYFKKIFPWFKGEENVIPIGSNIKALEIMDFGRKNFKNIIYFGQIRPKKGLDDLIVLAELIQKNNLDFSIKIIGQVLDKDKQYAMQLKERSKMLAVEWHHEMNESEVSFTLSQNAVAYLPFPDGVSERRGSFLAALANHMLVFTTRGEQTTAELAQFVQFISVPSNLLEFLMEGPDYLEILLKKIPDPRKFLDKFNWDSISLRHVSLYNTLIAKIPA